jgi:hypothetical protein
MTKNGKKDRRKSEPKEINQGSADQQSEMNNSESIVNEKDDQDVNDNNNQDKSESDEDENQNHDDNSETEKKSEKKEEIESEIQVHKEINHESTSAIQDSVTQTDNTQQATGEKSKKSTPRTFLKKTAMPKSPPIGRKGTIDQSKKPKSPDAKREKKSDKKAFKAEENDKSIDFDANHYDDTLFPYQFDWVGNDGLIHNRKVPEKIRASRELERIVNFRSTNRRMNISPEDARRQAARFHPPSFFQLEFPGGDGWKANYDPERRLNTEKMDSL